MYLYRYYRLTLTSCSSVRFRRTIRSNLAVRLGGTLTKRWCTLLMIRSSSSLLKLLRPRRPLPRFEFFFREGRD